MLQTRALIVLRHAGWSIDTHRLNERFTRMRQTSLNSNAQQRHCGTTSSGEDDRHVRSETEDSAC